MLDVLAPFAVPGGLSGLVLAGVWMILTGRLVPARTHDRMLADRDTQIDAWRSAHTAEMERGHALEAQVSELMELARTTVAVVKALPRPKDPVP